MSLVFDPTWFQDQWRVYAVHIKLHGNPSLILWQLAWSKLIGFYRLVRNCFVLTRLNLGSVKAVCSAHLMTRTLRFDPSWFTVVGRIGLSSRWWHRKCSMNVTNIPSLLHYPAEGHYERRKPPFCWTELSKILSVHYRVGQNIALHTSLSVSFLLISHRFVNFILTNPL